jgi:hypothetical protein
MTRSTFSAVLGLLLAFALVAGVHAQAPSPALAALQQARKDCGARLTFSRTKCIADIDKAIALLPPTQVTPPPVPPVVVPPVVPPVTPPPVVTPPVVVPPVVVPPVVTPPVVTPPVLTPPVVVPPVVVADAAVYISPSGNDKNAGTASAPVKTFAVAFTLVKPGGELVLLDGAYSVAAGTGIINYQGTGSAEIPSGLAGKNTLVHALHPGKVFVNGQLFVGRSDTKSRYITVDGITFDAGSSASAVNLYNTDHVTLRNGGFHSTINDGGAVFDLGNNDTCSGSACTNTNNLFEDVWIWGKARIIAGNYSADNNTWRRVVIRGDGCSSADCDSSGNPNVGLTVYNSRGTTAENVIVLDRVLQGSGNNYADFATAQHDSGTSFRNSDNQWLGNISLFAPDHCAYFEEENKGPSPDVTVQDFFCWKPKEVAAFQPKGPLVVNRLTTTDAGIDLEGSTITKSNIVTGATAASHAGGATVVFRYQDRVLTSTPLWPWQNEDRIKAEMCSVSPRGFCNAPSLTNYLWNLIGNGSPY